MNLLQKSGFFFAVLAIFSLTILLFFDITVRSIMPAVFRPPLILRRLDGKLQNLTLLKNTTTQRTLASTVPQEMKTILFYTAFFGDLPWPHTVGREKNLTDFSNRPCKVQACNFSISKDDLVRSHVVIFHGYWTPPPDEMKALLLKKPKFQMWAWFIEESQAQISYPLDKLNGMFELTITHMQNADVHTIYGEYFQHDEASRIKAHKLYQNKNFADGKDKLVLWFASNCVSLRLSIVKEIAKYIRVDVFGGCQSRLPNQSGSCSRRTPDCQKLNERYKFYLSFENSNCRGYLTEKYWENALDRNVVPIVIAGRYNKDVLIPGSYIDILDFPNAKALASYLKYLDKNDTAYNSYFDWKKKYRYTRETNWICDLCEYIHKSNTPKKEFWNLRKYWGKEENCYADDTRIREEWLKSSK